jgi:hypothetical protein
MKVIVSETPRRIARLQRHSPVLLKVRSGSVRVAQEQESLFGGDGLPVSATDGIQSWIWPEGEFWVCADAGGALIEVILP